MPFLPRAWNSVPEIPVFLRMFPPTTATAERFLSITTLSIWWSRISNRSSCSISLLADAEAPGRTARQREYSDDAWVTMRTLISSSARALNMRRPMPAIPVMPLPCMRRSATSSIEEIPLIRNRSDVFPLPINVPSKPGLNVFLIRMGIFLSSAGCIVGGWMTFAPKWDISIASS